MTETPSEWILTVADINVAAAACSQYHNTDVSSHILQGNLWDDQLLNPVSRQHGRPHSEWCHESFKYLNTKTIIFSSSIIRYNSWSTKEIVSYFHRNLLFQSLHGWTVSDCVLLFNYVEKALRTFVVSSVIWQMMLKEQTVGLPTFRFILWDLYNPLLAQFSYIIKWLYRQTATEVAEHRIWANNQRKTRLIPFNRKKVWAGPSSYG